MDCIGSSYSRAYSSSQVLWMGHSGGKWTHVGVILFNVNLTLLIKRKDR